MDTTDPLANIWIDRDAALPIHLQLREALRRAIRQGVFKVNDQLPSVEEMARRLGTSKATVMRALSDLGREGLLVGKRGAGTFVAEAAGRSVEVLVPQWNWEDPDDPAGSFFRQLLDGTRKELERADRDMCVSYLDGRVPSGQEILNVCSARRADGLVVYRPRGALAEELRKTAPLVPTVSLLVSAEVPLVDAVTVDPTKTLAKLLEKRIRAGRQSFVFVSYEGVLQRKRPEGQSMYASMLETFSAVLTKAGIEPQTCISPAVHKGDAYKELRKRSKEIPAAAVVVASNPDLAEVIQRSGVALDTITYTESKHTLDTLAGEFTFLYLGVDRAAREAVRLALSRRERGMDEPGQTITLAPQVFEAASARKRGRGRRSGPRR